jgi:nucleoside-diphosphate-sugar epimerase
MRSEVRKRLLIFGCGDIARRALPQLVKPYRVSALERSPGGLESLGVDPIPGDLDRPETLSAIAAVHTPDCVLHAAPPQRSGTTDLRTRNLLAALEGAIVPQRFVYLSTSGVYGDCHGERVEETRALNPRTDRARRRADAERVLTEWCEGRGTSLAILRVPGIYAPDRLPLERLRTGAAALRPEDDVYTNHIHADDLAAIVVRALDPDASAGVFNACDDSEIRMGDFFDLVADRFGLARPPRVSRAEALARVSPELASFMSESRRLCNGRMKEALGVRLRYPTVFQGVPAGVALAS